MLLADRKGFEEQLGALFGAWGRTTWEATTEGYWKGLTKMPLPDFMRTVDKAIQLFADDADMKLPNVGALWSIRRSLRSSAPAPQAPQPQWDGDRWDEAANRHLLTYIREKTALHHFRYAPDGRGPKAQARTRYLVQAKKRWAQLMRETAENGRVDSETQKAIWDDEMAQAEREIDAMAQEVAV